MKFSKFLSMSALVVGMISTLNAAQADWPKELKFSVIPTAGTSSLETRWSGVIKYLENALGLKITMQSSNDYTGIITSMAHKHTDIAYFGPESYVEAAKRANAQALVAELQKGADKPGYTGIIISKKDSGLKTIESLKGKTWAFTDPKSTSGTLVPSVMFARAGIDPDEYFSKVIYSGSHEASILSVKAGRVDAASTNDLDFEKGEGKAWSKDDFNFIWKSDLIVGAPIAARADLPEDLKAKIKQLLLDFKDTNELDKLNYSGFVDIKDSDYDSIRELIELRKKLQK
ncbi:phosphonate ABC transporter substrate-binding protein [Campylobacter suis]|uniref:Phosphite transport system-binding protein PtxB n=1 Tax=Campylobacter suis TaxID=2790657 RepID=A0ABM8Q8U9_9BACT|nr:phosphonate ABC transporter substrate-binding protein [Campylobacter suis]CAD7289326.1 putative phosphite transport system-binding protein PtxB [Campylobacter suis]